MKKFWEQAPALFVGCNLLVGAGCALYPHFSYILVFVLLWAPLILQKEWKKLLASVALVLLFVFHLTHAYVTPDKSAAKTEGIAYFKIDAVRVVQSPFNRSYLYQGTVQSFKTEAGALWRNIPCVIHTPYGKERPQADRDYLIEGALVQKKANTFVLKPLKERPWQPVPDTFSFAEWRYAMKDKVRNFLHREIRDSRAAALFVALSVGDLDERLLSLEFAKVGLQHILGISGFHFALLAGFLGLILRLFLPRKVAYIVLLMLLSGYFFFVGAAPPVMRGWVAISVFLIARLFYLNTNALNALGAGLCVEMLVSPTSITSIGFQLSYLCTWAILVLYPWFRRLVSFLLPKRRLTDLVEMRLLDQHGALFSALIREAVALNLAVHVASLPLILYLFHKFPLQSLLYNLFFPVCFSVSLLLLITASLFSFLLPPLGKLLHAINSVFTGTLLEVTAHPPPAFECYLRLKSFPFGWLVVALVFLFLWGTRAREPSRH